MDAPAPVSRIARLLVITVAGGFALIRPDLYLASVVADATRAERVLRTALCFETAAAEM